MTHDSEQHPALDDAAILTCYQEGDASRAQTWLIERYELEVTSYCVGMLGVADGPDAAHDALLAACQGLGHFKSKSSLRLWVFSIARNKCRNVWRQRRREQRTPAERANIARQAHCDPPLLPGQPSAAGRLEHIAQALDQLDEKARSLVLMRYRHGLTTSAMAELERVSKRTIERHLNQALKCLEEFLHDMG